MEVSAVIGLNKPGGFTSFNMVARLRRVLNTKKIGHAGTLDPMATGVLPMLVGKATKLCDIIPDRYKEYVAEFKLGILTDTLDITGQELCRAKVTVGRADVELGLGKYIGEFWQRVPMYSAVKVGGQKLYELARRGQEIERPQKLVEVTKLKLLEYDEQEKTGRLLVGCSKGTYIRALVDDLGRDLGCFAVLTSLCRTKSCGIELKQTVTPEELEDLVKAGELGRVIIGLDSFFKDYEEYSFNEQERARFLNGATVSKTVAPGLHQKLVRVYSAGEFLGLAEADAGEQKLRVFKLLV